MSETYSYKAVLTSDDLFGGLSRIREATPIAWCDEGFWLITRHADVQAFAKRSGKFSDHVTSDPTQMTGYAELRPYGQSGGPLESWITNKLLYTDPPKHTELRRPVQPEFTRKAIENSAGEIAGWICRTTLASLNRSSEFDVVTDFAVPYVVGVSTKLLGIPESDVPQVYLWLTEMAKADNGAHMMNSGQVRASGDAISQLRDYLRHVAGRRRDGEPVPPQLLLAPAGHESQLDEVRIDRMLEMLAGTSSAVGTIVTSFAALATARDQWARLKSRSVQTSVAVEELLRYTSVASGGTRFVTEPFTLHSVEFKPGDTVELDMRSANRDPRVFADPDVLDLSRSPNPHLVFGDGRHRCIGEHVVRVYTQAAIEGMVEAMSELSLPQGPPVLLEDRTGILGYEQLKAAASWEPAA